VVEVAGFKVMVFQTPGVRVTLGPVPQPPHAVPLFKYKLAVQLVGKSAGTQRCPMSVLPVKLEAADKTGCAPNSASKEVLVTLMLTAKQWVPKKDVTVEFWALIAWLYTNEHPMTVPSSKL
jgi:hypothetical protein